jgi:hypothetical protein
MAPYKSTRCLPLGYSSYAKFQLLRKGKVTCWVYIVLKAWDLGSCLHSPSCLYALEEHYPLWPNEIQSPWNRFQSMFCFEDWMDFKSFELLQMVFKIPFALKIACTFKILWWILNGFQITFSCEDCMGFKWTSIEFQMHFASKIARVWIHVLWCIQLSLSQGVSYKRLITRHAKKNIF